MRQRGKIWWSQAGPRFQSNSLHALCMLDKLGYTHTHTHTFRICNTYCSSTAKMDSRMHHIVTLYVHCLSCCVKYVYWSFSTLNIHTSICTASPCSLLEWLTSFRRKVLTSSSTLKTEAAYCYELLVISYQTIHYVLSWCWCPPTRLQDILYPAVSSKTLVTTNHDNFYHEDDSNNSLLNFGSH